MHGGNKQTFRTAIQVWATKFNKQTVCLKTGYCRAKKKNYCNGIYFSKYERNIMNEYSAGFIGWRIFLPHQHVQHPLLSMFIMNQ